MKFLLIFLLLPALITCYLFITKPKNMPFMGHFADKILYGSLYYIDKPDISYSYAKRDKVNLKLHFFIPKKSELKSSVLLFHGGGWAFGSSYSLFKICKSLAKEGILCASADYRLALKHDTKVKDSMLDAADAYKWMVKNSEKLNIKKDQIMVGGGSSGGHLAASLAMIPDEKNETYDNIKAMILFNPALNTSALNAEIPENIDERRKNLWLYVRKLFEGKFEDLSPSNFIRSDLPPSIIFHGEKDKTIPIFLIEDFTKEMKEKGNQVDLLKWKDNGHQFYRWDKKAYPEVMEKLVSFVKAQSN
jgi:acetyl esterase/lipase|tara:strand:+ start:65 stop:976 length:912 start_codon:yes stop_codon:yes gene_type:complete